MGDPPVGRRGDPPGGSIGAVLKALLKALRGSGNGPKNLANLADTNADTFLRRSLRRCLSQRRRCMYILKWASWGALGVETVQPGEPPEISASGLRIRSRGLRVTPPSNRG